MSWKGDYIEKYGQDAYDRHLAQSRESAKAYREQNIDKVIENHRQATRKGGKYYEKRLIYKQTGISGDKARIRMNHSRKWRPYKAIIARDSQIHHNWLNDGTAAYDGVALVEKDQHQHGIIDVIQILEGKITLLTEEEVRKGCKNETE